MSFNPEPRGLDDVLDAIERLHEWFRLNRESEQQMGNWIKPEKCNGFAVNLDLTWCVVPNLGNERFTHVIEFLPPVRVLSVNQVQCAWFAKNEEDRDHDYQRVLRQLGLSHE